VKDLDPRLRRHALGFLEAIDRPTPEALSAYYAETYYQSGQGSFRPSYSDLELSVIRQRVTQRAERALGLMGHDRKGSLLDVGCGEGFVLKAFAELGWRVSGMDFSIAGIETMNPDMAPFVTQGDVFKLLDQALSSNQTYDLIWLGNVLEHVLDPVGLLNTLHPLVAPNGLLVVTVPNDGSAYQEDLFNSGAIDRRFWIALPDHLSYFTADSLRSTAKATGWDALDILGDFPIDLFLTHPASNYVADPARGGDAHLARLKLEALIGAAGPEAANRFYSALSEVGLGRNLTAFLRPMTAQGTRA
jgi:2-polyprenyl-3-methyl-5-hydroxy-6-metoxy-1,4-benzoquinol methylase